ncbi:hypothetical protein AGR3A_Cc190140 [Agrobacterium tomkonis CFBP 6623]|uniref:Uncharacterized protein n=1 Tax=Agrobacterium tomkonis CFBP 6623 TaxID=1183432 RepID=A0A1S7P2N7_9HYPH|nr:hypothetical protein AGR3A_Cc190140 [Agrobacterium tomkonis CFBP 6623]
MESASCIDLKGSIREPGSLSRQHIHVLVLDAQFFRRLERRDLVRTCVSVSQFLLRWPTFGSFSYSLELEETIQQTPPNYRVVEGNYSFARVESQAEVFV